MNKRHCFDMGRAITTAVDVAHKLNGGGIEYNFFARSLIHEALLAREAKGLIPAGTTPQKLLHPYEIITKPRNPEALAEINRLLEVHGIKKCQLSRSLGWRDSKLSTYLKDPIDSFTTEILSALTKLIEAKSVERKQEPKSSEPSKKLPPFTGGPLHDPGPKAPIETPLQSLQERLQAHLDRVLGQGNMDVLVSTRDGVTELSLYSDIADDSVEYIIPEGEVWAVTLGNVLTATATLLENPYV